MSHTAPDRDRVFAQSTMQSYIGGNLRQAPLFAESLAGQAVPGPRFWKPFEAVKSINFCLRRPLGDIADRAALENAELKVVSTHDGDAPQSVINELPLRLKTDGICHMPFDVIDRGS